MRQKLKRQHRSMGACCASGLRAVKPGGRIGGHGGILHPPTEGCQQGNGMTDKNDAGPSGWRRYWPDSRVLLFGIGALGAIPGILLAALASWLRRWPSIRTVALWLMIPCLCVTWMVVQNQRRQHLRDVAEARVEQPEAEQATDYAQIAPRPTLSSQRSLQMGMLEKPKRSLRRPRRRQESTSNGTLRSRASLRTSLP